MIEEWQAKVLLFLFQMDNWRNFDDDYTIYDICSLILQKEDVAGERSLRTYLYELRDNGVLEHKGNVMKKGTAHITYKFNKKKAKAYFYEEFENSNIWELAAEYMYSTVIKA